MRGPETQQIREQLVQAKSRGEFNDISVATLEALNARYGCNDTLEPRREAARMAVQKAWTLLDEEAAYRMKARQEQRKGDALGANRYADQASDLKRQATQVLTDVLGEIESVWQCRSLLGRVQ